MPIHLIIIGNELLNGKTKDQHVYWLANELRRYDREISSAQFLPDDIPMIKSYLKPLLASPETTLIVTGGLGPTKDDITKKALAEAVDVAITFSPVAQAMALSHYQRQGKTFNADNHPYSQMPVGFDPVGNPVGLAPGLLYHNPEIQNLLLALPGVPTEFQAMIRSTLVPILQRERTTEAPLVRLTFRTRGIPEEQIFSHMAPKLWDELAEWGTVSSLPRIYGVDIGVSTTLPSGLSAEKWQHQITAVLHRYPELAASVWQIGELELPEWLLQQALKKNLTIGCAESCTGGLIGSMLTDIPGSSQVFKGSIVSYANAAKEQLLDVPAALLQEFGAVSIETAQAMAMGARHKLNVDIAVATTGIAGPGGGTPQKPVGTVAIAIASAKSNRAIITQLRGDRLSLKNRFAHCALHQLLEEIDDS